MKSMKYLGAPGVGALALAVLLSVTTIAGAALADGITVWPPNTNADAAAQLEAVRAELAEAEKRLNALQSQEGALKVEVAKAAQAAILECPALTQVKYPWLTCTTTAWGTKELAEVGSVRGDEMPAGARVSNWQSSWVDGPGYWGR